MKKTSRPIAAVFCLWKAVKGGRFRWKLAETYGADDDGHPVTPTTHTAGGRHAYESFLGAPERPLMGRSVTVWTMTQGVRLVCFNPPEWTPWLGIGFYEAVAKMPNGFALLADGHTLLTETAREAERLLGTAVAPGRKGRT